MSIGCVLSTPWCLISQGEGERSVRPTTRCAVFTLYHGSGECIQHVGLQAQLSIITAYERDLRGSHVEFVT